LSTLAPFMACWWSWRSRKSEMRPGRLHHVGIVVNDLEKAVESYGLALGLLPAQRRDFPALGVRSAFYPLGEAFLEVMTPLSSEGPVARFLEERGEGMYLMALQVDDLEGALAELKAKGVSVSEPTGASISGRMAFVSPRSANGVLIELVENGAPW
jgi:methylmalonyl-CoA/ethylmalonyl-CoA epimerase